MELTADKAFDRETVTGLLRQEPEGGVLSIYVNADARSDPGLQAAGIDIRNRLSQLERNLADEESPEHARALAEGLQRLRSEIERALSPHERGRGRALFAPVEGGQVISFASQMPVANRVVLDASAFVHPLLELLDEGRPAGVVLASQDEARLLEWRLGELEELDRMQPDVVETPHERSGPVGTSPVERAGTPKREQRAARERDRTLRFLDRVGDTATAMAGDRDWERVLVSGGERLTEPLATRLQAPVVRDPRTLIQLDSSALSETVTERLRTEHSEQEERLQRDVREAALGAGSGAVGLSDVVGALTEGRVAHLVYDPEVRYQGSIAADGTLRAGDERAGDGPATPEPRLTERLVERALDTGARVTPVEGAARGALAEAEGIGALLRW
jgi:hypothetical protein